MRLRLCLVGALILTGCSDRATDPLRIGVASSLTEAVAEVAGRYDGAELEVSVAGSQVLAAQVREGAPLDVIIAADEATLGRLDELGLLAGDPVRFAGNRLAIAVAPGNPRGITGLSALTETGLIVVLAAPEVPAGAYTARMLAAAGLEVEADSFEPSVRAVLARVRLGEADAGVVYETDLRAAPVDGVLIPPGLNVEAAYYAAVVAGTSAAERAQHFVSFLQSDDARAALAGLGFLP